MPAQNYYELYRYVSINHYSDVIMIPMASQITSVSIVCSAVGSGTDERKHRSSASLAFVWWPVCGDRWIPHTKVQQRVKCFHLMTSLWSHVPLQVEHPKNICTWLCCAWFCFASAELVCVNMWLFTHVIQGSSTGTIMWSHDCSSAKDVVKIWCSKKAQW